MEKNFSVEHWFGETDKGDSLVDRNVLADVTENTSEASLDHIQLVFRLNLISVVVCTIFIVLCTFLFLIHLKRDSRISKKKMDTPFE